MLTTFRSLYWLTALVFLTTTTAHTQTALPDRPNFIIIFADDLGYGDLGSYGHPTIRTPNLDRMAAGGQRWTNFYVGASVCTPSRAAILTGRLPVRSGMSSHKSRVLFPNSLSGLPPEEITLAEHLKPAGYATAAVGKWHLGHKKPHLPTNQGFDSYYGIPYSNDMSKVREKGDTTEFWHSPASRLPASYDVPLMRDEEVIERPADQTTITRRYTDEAVRFIEENQDGPFFLYLAHNLPHVPLFVSEDFEGVSERGLYGDVLAEIDHGVGRIREALEKAGIAENTVVVFTSDNGPWLTFDEDGGSAGLLREGKGTTWEGGMREPGIFWSPGNIEPAVVSDLGTTMDLFTTFSRMAGQLLPDDRITDGVDLTETLLRGGPSPREEVFYYRGDELYALRSGDFKAHFITQGEYGGPERVEHNPPLLYNLSIDPSEKYDIAEDHPEVLEEIAELKRRHEAKVVKGEDQLAARE